ncbi:MAG: PAS domain-containing protein [Chloroflexi bacterium]|nr:PAS domain-containing protein [Chloroflexota bacterium]
MAEKRAGGENGQTDEGGALPARGTRTMLDEMSLEIVLADSDDIVAYFNKDTSANPRMCEILGKKVQECHPEESAPLVSQILEEFKSGNKASSQLEIRLDEKVVNVRFSSLRDNDGNYLGCVEVTQQVDRVDKEWIPHEVTRGGRPILSRASQGFERRG